MKKILILLMILTVAVFCSACINNYAIHQLNEKAKEYSDKGDLQSAVSRLEASIDLDGSIFETRYNLIVAYLDLNECDKALNQIEATKKLKDEASLYYLEGNGYSCLANGVFKDEENEENSKDDIQKALEYIEYQNSAITAYETYLKMSVDSSKQDEITNRINDLRASIDNYKAEYNL